MSKCHIVGIHMSRLICVESQFTVLTNQRKIKPQEVIFKPYEPRHVISNNVVCANSKGSDRSLIRAFASRLNIL